MPQSTFEVRDVVNIIGPGRVTNVVDVSTQTGCQMTLADWASYWYAGGPGREREQLLNVISLEFSLTKLDSQVMAPEVVSD